MGSEIKSPQEIDRILVLGLVTALAETKYLLGTVLAQRYAAGSILEFDPADDVDIVYPAPRVTRLSGPSGDVVIRPRSGLVDCVRCRVEGEFWSFSIVFTDHGTSGDELSLDMMAEEVLEVRRNSLAAPLAAVAQKVWEARGPVREPGAQHGLSFSAVFKLTPSGGVPNMELVRVVDADAMQRLLRELAAS